jgi:phosphoglycerol transferase MdoB-like AlkP superfamily enzyme
MVFFLNFVTYLFCKGMNSIRKIISKSLFAPMIVVIINIFLVYIVYFLARLIYMLVNYNYFADNMSAGHFLEMFGGGIVFDTSAIIYTNLLYVVMMLFPLHFKETEVYHKICKYVFIISNGLTLVMNLADSVYFQYTMRRTTCTVFSEFGNEHNIGSIIGVELLQHWYLIVAAAFILFGLWKAYFGSEMSHRKLMWWRYDAVQFVCLVAATPFCVAGIRGGFATAVRPITISNANQYADRPMEAALVLNTPFSMIRTIGKAVFVVPDYYKGEKELASVFTPVHSQKSKTAFRKKNVVVFIIESFGREYIGAFNKTLEGGRYKGYTPFVDSLISQSVVFKYSFCNGRKSIDGMPSILSGIPMFIEPFFLTPASMNHVSGLAGTLDSKGYYTAFFHGAQDGSMGFQAFARATGFKHYYGREEFDADKRFGGDKDFDGTWAIWDEPFLQYYCTKMSEIKQPFMTAVFTASSHHPYVIPDKYKNVFKEEGSLTIHKCIRYTDYSLRKFFEKAKKQPWFKNTIFVLTSDHTNQSDHAQYKTDIGGFCSPIIIYDPSGELKPGMRDAVAQQIDIMPTVLNYLGYDKPFVSFGCDLLNTPGKDTYAVNYINGIYQYVKFGYVLQFDGVKTKAIYSLEDKLMQRNLVGKVPEQAQMEKELKAIIQQYMERMTQNRLIK